MGPVVSSIPKTKLLVTGASCSKDEELRPLKLDEDEIECVQYLGSVANSRGDIMKGSVVNSRGHNEGVSSE